MLCGVKCTWDAYRERERVLLKGSGDGVCVEYDWRLMRVVGVMM